MSSTNGNRPATRRPWATQPTTPGDDAPTQDTHPTAEVPTTGPQAWPGDEVGDLLAGAAEDADTRPRARQQPPRGDAHPGPVRPVDRSEAPQQQWAHGGGWAAAQPAPPQLPDPAGPRWGTRPIDATQWPVQTPPGPGGPSPVGPPAGPPAEPGPVERPRHGEISRDMLLRPAKPVPSRGWRRVVHLATGGSVTPALSADDVRRHELAQRVNQVVRGTYNVAELSMKGGVGKTAVTVGLGSTLAALRGDHVIAVDANPDLGTLAERIPRQTPATIRDLLNEAAAGRIHRYGDVRAFTSQAPSRLEVLASERDPSKAEAFSEAEYLQVIEVLETYYNLILTDCGTGLTHSVMSGVLATADALVLVSSPALDGAQSADATLAWLDAQGYHHLVERTVFVISAAKPGSTSINVPDLVAHFETKVRAVHVLPFDPHLAEGSIIDLERLQKPTRHALEELAAMVADDFPSAAGRHHGPAGVGR